MTNLNLAKIKDFISLILAQHDEEISQSLKSKHGLEDHPLKGT